MADTLPSAVTVIKAIAAASGKLKGHPDYMSKNDMARLCYNWLRKRAAKKST